MPASPTSQRFYKTATASPAEGDEEGSGYRVRLDGRPIRTPGGRPLILPAEALAEAVAAEWQAQTDRINVSAMAFTRLAATAVDRVAEGRPAVIDTLLSYAGGDVLCYRAEEGVPPFVERTHAVLGEAGIRSYELILVGNYTEGSPDRTPGIVAGLAAQDPRVRHVARPKAGMMGWDMRSGLELARGRHVAVIDGDGQMPVEDLVRVYRVISVDNLDLVKTYRLRRGDGWRRSALSFFYNLAFAFLFPGTFSRDVNSKPKILTRKAYEALDLRSDDWFIDAEILIQARDRGLRIGEIPTSFHGLGGRRSFVRPAAVLEFVKNLTLYRVKSWLGR